MAYPAKKDPFLEDDDDEFSFGGRGRQTAPYTTRTVTSGGAAYNPWDEPKSDGYEYESRPRTQAEQLMDRKENSMNSQLESTRRVMASIYDSERVGIATAEELVRQGEQLDNIERKTHDINADMKSTQKNINSIKSVFGGIKNWWSGRAEEKEKTNEPQASSRPENPRLQEALNSTDRRPDVHPAMRVRGEDVAGFYEDDLDSQFMAGSARGGGSMAAGGPKQSSAGAFSQQQRQERVTSFQKYDQQFNENIDVMSDGMARLKMLASGLGDEIASQNEQIDDRILPNVERADQNIRDQNRQMRKILGAKK